MFRLTDLLVVGGAYLLGGCLTGYYLVRLRCGEDIRRFGSGSAGARNVGRRLGRWAFALTFAGDLLKGVAAVVGAKLLTGHSPVVVWALVAVVAGHLWPLQLRGKGGKGLSTAFGGLLALHWPTVVWALLLIPPCWLLTRRSTAAVLLAAIALPLVATLNARPFVEIGGLAVVAALILWGHRENIRALLQPAHAEKDGPEELSPD